jgi:hypothetical protein
MDQMGENRYTNDSESVSRTSSLPSAGPESGSGGLGGLPDLDSVAGLFSSSEEEPVEGPAERTEPERTEPERKPSGNKAQKMEGDFKAKDLAEGIRTILSKD